MKEMSIFKKILEAFYFNMSTPFRYIHMSILTSFVTYIPPNQPRAL